MIRTSFTLLALALAAAAIAAPIARSSSAPKVDPLAVGYLMGQGLSRSEVTSWTVGACSRPVKAASCYAMLTPAARASTQIARSIGFQWGDAGIGAGFALGVILLLAGTGAGLLVSRQNRRHHTARA